MYSINRYLFRSLGILITEYQHLLNLGFGRYIRVKNLSIQN